MVQFSATLFILFAILPNLCLSLPAAASAPKSTGKAKASSTKPVAPALGTGASSTPASGNGPSSKQISNAVVSWMNDTGKVTKFLNTATSFSGDEFTRQATIALNAEKDELNHKMVLDAAVGQMESVQTANATLEGKGSFQAVVDALQSMVDNGPDTAQSQVDAINKNRCVNVLPNIDAYFAAAGAAEMTAVRPTGCLEVEAVPASTSTPAEGAPPADTPPTSLPEVGAPATSKSSSAPGSKVTGKSTSKAASKAAAAKTTGSMVGAKAAPPATRTSSRAPAAETPATGDEAPAADAPADTPADAPATTSSSSTGKAGPKATGSAKSSKASAKSTASGSVLAAKATPTKPPSTVKAASAAKAKAT